MRSKKTVLLVASTIIIILVLVWWNRDAGWFTYKNESLGIAMELPRQHWFYEKSGELSRVEVGETHSGKVAIMSVLPSTGAKKKIAEFAVESQVDEARLKQLVREYFGDGCLPGEMTATAWKDTFDVRVSTEVITYPEGFTDPKCFINSPTGIKYSPKLKKAALWKIISQDQIFFYKPNGADEESGDERFKKSFRFL